MGDKNIKTLFEPESRLQRSKEGRADPRQTHCKQPPGPGGLKV